MSRIVRSPMLQTVFAGLVLIFASATTAVCAEDPGLETLNQATELKFSAQTLPDFNQVIRLCEKAIEEGLTGENLDFCEQLLGATHLLKGKIVSELILEQFEGIRDWRQIRAMALEDLEKAVKYLPDQAIAYLLIARLNLLPEGNRDTAAKAVEKALEYAYDDMTIKAEAFVVKADLEENREKRIQLLKDAVALLPDSPAALTALGNILFEVGELDDALEALRRALEIEPDSSLTLMLVVRILTVQEKYDEALKTLELLDGIEPNTPFSLIQKMDIYLAQEKLDEALEILNNLRKKAPGNPMILLQRAAIYLEKKDFEAATKDVDAALRLVEENSDEEYRATRLKSLIWIQQEQYTDAIRFLKGVISEKPDRLKPIYEKWLVQTYLIAKINQKAIDMIDKLLQHEPESLELLRWRADALLGVGKHSEAIAEYEKILEKIPEDSGALNNLSWVLCTSTDDTLRDGQRALELALKSCELTEYKLPHILSTLAAAYAETGDFDTAVEWIDKGLELANLQNYDQKEHLDKERASYLEKKPWREILDENNPDPTENDSKE